MLNLSQYNSHNKKINKINIKPYAPRLEKGINSDKKIIRSPLALIPRKPKPKSNSTAGRTWRLELSLNQDLIADEKARCRAAGQLDKEWLQLLTSRLRLPYPSPTHADKNQDNTKVLQDTHVCTEVLPSWKLLFLHLCPSKSHSSKTTQSPTSFMMSFPVQSLFQLSVITQI